MKNSLIRSALSFLSMLIFAAFISPAKASAEDTLSGQWSYTLYLSGDPIGEGLWTLKQVGSALIGAGSTGSTTWTSTGSIIGTDFAKVDSYNGSTYIIGFQGTVNQSFTEITGSWNDTLANEGTFTAVRLAPVEFSPQTKIEDAPAITIVSKNITVTMEKFNKALPKGTRSILRLVAHDKSAQAAKASKPRLSIKYEVSVKGATKQQTRQKIVSKRNEVTIKKLAPGNYTTTYRAQAFQGEKRVYQSNVSPAASFTIR